VTLAKPVSVSHHPPDSRVADTVSVPVAPPVTKSVESTRPSKCPPDWNQRMATLLSGRLPESWAVAASLIVSLPRSLPLRDAP